MARGSDDRPFIAVQWGTTALQAMLVAPDGALLDVHRVDVPLASLDRPAMAGSLARIVERWPHAEPEPWLSGMIGSELGWTEVPPVPCPANAAALAAASVQVLIGAVRARVLPGIVQRPPMGDPDRMRGEEVWALGHLAYGHADCVMLAVPGGHGKWITLKDGRIRRFHTTTTVEFARVAQAYAAMASGIVGTPRADAAFLDGVREGGGGRPLSRLAFGARARMLDGTLARGDAASFLWGTFVGADVADALISLTRDQRVAVVGAPDSVALFAAAIDMLGGRALTPASDALAARGFAQVRALRPPTPAILEEES